MTTPHEPEEQPREDAPALSAAEESAVRRVLADAGTEPEPIPADVAARLDDVLATEYAERASGGPAATELAGPAGPKSPVVALAARRRHRVRLLVGAAAAAVVAGLGIQLMTDDQGSDMLNAQTEQDPVRGANEDSAARNTPSDGPNGAPAPSQLPESLDSDSLSSNLKSPERNQTDEPVQTVRTRHVRDDLIALQAVALPKTAADYDGVAVTAPKGFNCSVGDVGDGILIGIRFEGAPAFAAYREPNGSTQVAEVLQCETGESLRSVTIPSIH